MQVYKPGFPRRLENMENENGHGKVMEHEKLAKSHDQSFLMRWVFMHIALKGCSPPHTNEPVQFWIGFGLVLIGGSGLNPLGLLTPHWIIQLVIDRNAIENL